MTDNDNGYKSRKFIFAVLTSGLIVVCGCVAALCAGFSNNLPVVITGLLGSFTIYAGANVTHKVFTKGRDISLEPSSKEEAEGEDEPEVKEEVKK
jgi:hypothetical protein